MRDLTRAAYAKWVPVIGCEPRPMIADYDVAVRDHLVDLLHAHGRLVALIEMRPHPDHLLIVNVAVSPEFQGRGHGRALLTHAEQVATSLGHAELRLYTNSRFPESPALRADRLSRGSRRAPAAPRPRHPHAQEASLTGITAGCRRLPAG